MIVLVKIGGGSGGASRYNINKVATDHGELLCSTIAQNADPRQIGKEFDAVSALRPRVKKSIVHMIIAISPNDAAMGTAFNFRLWLFELQKRLKLDASQMIAWQHYDTAHPHIHAVLNRVRPDGTVVSMWRKGLIMKKFCIDMSDKFGLSFTPRGNIKKELSQSIECESSQI